jgi:toxin ParE1/3/4
MVFKIRIEPLAKLDIQTEILYYNSKRKGLGKRFHTEIVTSFESIKANPFFQVRYDKVHCLPLKKFPAMIHYSLDEGKKLIVIRAVINTNRNPDTTWLK